jgi:hypothetical protein
LNELQDGGKVPLWCRFRDRPVGDTRLAEVLVRPVIDGNLLKWCKLQPVV